MRKLRQLKGMRGYLTYTLAVVAILWGAFGFTMGWVDAEQAMVAVWTGLAAFGIRRAIH
jgi:hypothetical protein